jgi:hypothetical protein
MKIDVNIPVFFSDRDLFKVTSPVTNDVFLLTPVPHDQECLSKEECIQTGMMALEDWFACVAMPLECKECREFAEHTSRHGSKACCFSCAFMYTTHRASNCKELEQRFAVKDPRYQRAQNIVAFDKAVTYFRNNNPKDCKRSTYFGVWMKILGELFPEECYYHYGQRAKIFLSKLDLIIKNQSNCGRFALEINKLYKSDAWHSSLESQFGADTDFLTGYMWHDEDEGSKDLAVILGKFNEFCRKLIHNNAVLTHSENDSTQDQFTLADDMVMYAIREIPN